MLLLSISSLFITVPSSFSSIHVFIQSVMTLFKHQDPTSDQWRLPPHCNLSVTLEYSLSHKSTREFLPKTRRIQETYKEEEKKKQEEEEYKRVCYLGPPPDQVPNYLTPAMSLSCGGPAFNSIK